MTPDVNARLTGEQVKMLADGLLDAFTDFDDLARLVRVALNKRLNKIVAQRATFEDQVWQLVDWAEAKGKIADLLGAAVEAVPGNARLREAERAVLGGTTGGGRTLHRPLQHLRRRAANFTGRRGELDRLVGEVRAKASDGTSLCFVGLKGAGGVGKTALAAELAERLRREEGLFPGGVLWANLHEETPEQAARRWVADLGGDALGLGPEEAMQRFHEVAVARRPLVVLDNVPGPGAGGNLAEPLLVKTVGVATLLTTRFRDAVPAGVRVEELDVLPPDEARALLRSHLDPAAEDDPAEADLVELCERLPLFLNVAGAAVAKGYYSLAGYAEELRRRGLAALAEEDETGRAGLIFDLSWDRLSDNAKEVFAVLALVPGEDVGPNLIRAWKRTARVRTGGWRRWLAPRRWWATTGRSEFGDADHLLVELANASLLSQAAGRAGRYRYHDRVRDYALTRLTIPEDEARRRLLMCWTDWDTVKGEFEAVGADGLATQYLRLRSWGVEEPPDLAPWFHFALGQASVLGMFPELFFQQAFNELADSPVSRAAQERIGTAEEPGRWLEWLNRPREWVPPACLMVLLGHTDYVTSVALSVNRQAAVSGSEDKTVRAWDLSAGRCIAVLEGHADRVHCVALSEDGRTALSGSWDNTVRVWDLTQGISTSILEGHTDAVLSVALSKDGRAAVSGSGDKTVRVWNLASGRCIAVLEEHTDAVMSVALSADGRTAVSGSIDRTVRVWDLSAGHCTAVLEGHTGRVDCVALSADGQAAASGSGDMKVRAWNLASGHCTAVLEGHTDAVMSVALSKDGQVAVSGSVDKTVRVWKLDTACRSETKPQKLARWLKRVVTQLGHFDAKPNPVAKTTARCTAILEGHAGYISSVALSADGRVALSGSFDKTVRLWDLTSGSCTAMPQKRTLRVENVRLSEDGQTAVSREYEGTVRVWDLSTGLCTATHQRGSEGARDASLKARVSWPLHIGPYGLTLRDFNKAVLAHFPGSFVWAVRSDDFQHVVAHESRDVYILRLHTRRS
jgi:WD40 repeat protein